MQLIFFYPSNFSWLQTQQRKKQVSYSSFHEEMLAQSIELQQKEQEKKHQTEMDQQMSKEERDDILEEVAKTQVI